jgi:hypothetical protein
MTRQVGTKWKLRKVCLSTCFFVVVHRDSGREYQYQVPNMEAVELSEDCVYVYTNTNKVLLIDLVTTKRKFIEKKPFKSSLESTDIRPNLSLVKVSRN